MGPVFFKIVKVMGKKRFDSTYMDLEDLIEGEHLELKDETCKTEKRYLIENGVNYTNR